MINSHTDAPVQRLLPKWERTIHSTAFARVADGKAAHSADSKIRGWRNSIPSLHIGKPGGEPSGQAPRFSSIFIFRVWFNVICVHSIILIFKEEKKKSSINVNCRYVFLQWIQQHFQQLLKQEHQWFGQNSLVFILISVHILEFTSKKVHVG